MSTKIENPNIGTLEAKERKASKSTLAGFLLWFGLVITLIGSLSYFLQYTGAMSFFDARLPGLYVSLTGIVLSTLGFAQEQKKAGVSLPKSLGVRIVIISLVLTALYIGNTFFAYQQEEVQFTNGDVTLVGTLLVPNNEGPHPALVMMHGAGEATRMGQFAEAQSLVRSGVAVLIYDKRGSGASVGGHYRLDGYEALASDGVAAIHFLRGHRDIDPKQIGLWGTSEGGWTAPMTAAQVEDLALLIIISGGPVTPAEQGNYEIAYRMGRWGFSDEAIEQAVELSEQVDDYYRTGHGRDELLAHLQQAEREEWFEAIGFSTTVPLYSEMSERELWWRDHMDTDIAPLLSQMDFPILFVLGGNDALMPSQMVKTRVDTILGDAGLQDFTVELIPEAGHNLVAAPTTCRLCIPDDELGPFLPWFAPGYLDTVSNWVSQRVEVVE